jgi:hypothetical protein
MNVLLLCEALAQKIADEIEIPNPAEVDFAAQRDFDAVIDSVGLDREDLTELIRIGTKNLP